MRQVLSSGLNLVLGVALFIAFCVFAYLVFEMQGAIWDWLGI